MPVFPLNSFHISGARTPWGEGKHTLLPCPLHPPLPSYLVSTLQACVGRGLQRWTAPSGSPTHLLLAEQRALCSLPWPQWGRLCQGRGKGELSFVGSSFWLAMNCLPCAPFPP